MDKSRPILVLFDIDGTLTKSRQRITPEMEDFMSKLRQKVTVGVVGGSDYVKQKEQLGDNVAHEFDFAFSENGLLAFKNGEKFHEKSFVEFLGEEKMQKLINFCLEYFSKLVLPKKRGTFIEFRKGMLNICPVGRSCSQEEREEFNEFDNVHKVREKMCAVLAKEFEEYKLSYVIGGQISIDIFPQGWDKTYCLQHIEHLPWKEIHFFGDKTTKGGNDYEIFADSRTIGHTVTSPQDTREQVTKLFL